MTLTLIENETERYYIDSNGLMQGEYKDYWSDGATWWHCLYKDGVRHGEFKSTNSFGKLNNHCIVIHGEEKQLSEEEMHFLNNISSKEELLAMTLKYGVPLLASLKYGD